MRLFSTALAIATGIIILLGYFVPAGLFLQVRLLLTDWAIIIAGMAVLVGIYNIVAVQMEKIRNREKGGMYGILLILGLIITFVFGVALGTNDSLVRLAVNAVIQPVEAALLAMLTVTLIYASIRLFRRRADLMTVVFLATAVIVLLAAMPTPFGQIPVLGDWIGPWIRDVLASGGARGLLIGVALGTVMTGLRVLFGVDRPYGGN